HFRYTRNPDTFYGIFDTQEMMDVRKFHQFLRSRVICISCELSLNLENIKIVSQDYIRFYIECEKCGASYIFALDYVDGMIALEGIRTDLNYKDLLKFEKKDPISIDEVIDISRSLA